MLAEARSNGIKLCGIGNSDSPKFVGKVVGDMNQPVLGEHVEPERHVYVGVEPIGNRDRERNVNDERVVTDVDARTVSAQLYLVASAGDHAVRLYPDDVAEVAKGTRDGFA
jgi:hypothetical protein